MYGIFDLVRLCHTDVQTGPRYSASCPRSVPGCARQRQGPTLLVCSSRGPILAKNLVSVWACWRSASRIRIFNPYNTQNKSPIDASRALRPNEAAAGRHREPVREPAGTTPVMTEGSRTDLLSNAGGDLVPRKLCPDWLTSPRALPVLEKTVHHRGAAGPRRGDLRVRRKNRVPRS
jgi:hypothetical protein